MRQIIPLALVLALCGRAAAYDIAQLEKDSRAYQARMAKEVGDLRIEQEGKMFVQDRSGDVAVVMFRKGDRWRAEAHMSRLGAAAPEGAKPLDTIQLFDGKELWQSTMGMTSKFKGFSPSRGPTVLNAFAAAFGDSAKVGGEEKLEGRDCWIVETPLPVPSPQMAAMVPEVTRTWVDKKTFSWLKSETKVGDRVMRTIFSDFRSVKGFEIPYVTEVFRNEEKTMAAKIVKLEANAALPDSLFDPGKLPVNDNSEMMRRIEEMKAEMAARKLLEAQADSAAADSAARTNSDAPKKTE